MDGMMEFERKLRHMAEKCTWLERENRLLKKQRAELRQGVEEVQRLMDGILCVLTLNFGASDGTGKISLEAPRENLTELLRKYRIGMDGGETAYRFTVEERERTQEAGENR